ncbi:MAG: hypothetical protein SFU86_05515, partial [Pirellulaceae bacterium]|nr:hypothetical protein [Pirellulaceae bacterium]
MKPERTTKPAPSCGLSAPLGELLGPRLLLGGRFASAAVTWLALMAFGVTSLYAAPFGRVVPIGGRAADLALDEARRVVYVANFTANRIDVLAADGSGLQTSWSVSPQPGSVALSRDGRWLLVTHFGNFAPPAARNSLTLIQLETGARQTFALTSAPLGAAFGVDGLALVITATEFLTFDPATGAMQVLGSISDYTANVLPQPASTGPPAVIAATMAASRDGRWIYCITSNYRFRYEVVPKRMLALAYVAEPPLGPRAVSVNDDGSLYTAGWGLFSRRGTILAQFENVSGLLDVGSHAIDSRRGVVYAHVPRGQGLRSTNLPPPVLEVADSENLAVRERLELAENLAGRSVLSADGRMMYAASDSGVTFLPVGQLDQERRVVAALEDLVFRPSACDRRVMTLDLPILDLSGQATEFQLSTTMAGLRLSQSAGVTPAIIQVSIDPAVFPASVTGTLTLTARESIRTGESVRVVVNVTEPDQRGTPLAIPGRLVDLLADPQRDRFYVLRQDRNQVMAFDGTTRALLATWKTGQTPTQLAISFDRRFLLVGNDNSQIANVIDLETFEPSDPIVFPGGHYPRSLASSGRATLAAARVAGPEHKMDR